MSLKRGSSQTIANKGAAAASAQSANMAVASVGGMSISSVYATDSSYIAVTPARSAVSTTGGYVSIIGLGFAPGNQVYVQGVPATAVTYVGPTKINAQLPAFNTSGQSVQQLAVVNTATNSAGILITGFLYSVMPYWTVSSSQLLFAPAISASLAALSDSALTYSVYSGTLPNGLTLNTGTGVISGTVSAETSTSVVIYAVDQELQTNTQTFTLTIILSDPNIQYNSLLLNGETAVKPFNADASTSSFEIAVLGDTRPNNFNPYSNGFYSNYFNGSTDHFTVAQSAALELNTGTSFTVGWTIEAWIFPTAYAGGGGWIVSKDGTASTSYTQYGLSVGSTGVIQGTLGTGGGAGGGDSNTSYGTAVAPLNSWTHIAFVNNAQTITLYVNGSVNFTGPIRNMRSGSAALFIGYQNAQPANQRFIGYISNLRLVNGTAVYTGAFTPSTAPLIATTGTVLLTCQSPRFIDVSSISNTITISGTPTIQPYVPFAPTTTVSVPTLYSTKFNGTTDYLTSPSNALLAFGTGDFTAEVWIYPTTIASNQVVFDHRPDGTHGTYASMLFESGYIRWYVSSATQIQSTSILALNSWTHVAVCRVSGTTRMYINGVLSGSPWTDSTTYLIGAAGMAIGASTWSGARNYFTGFISNLRITKGTALYTASFTPSTAPLTATTGTVLLTCQRPTLVDNSTSTFTITSVGSAQPVTATPFTQTYASQAVSTLGSGYFDGIGDYLTGPATSGALGSGDFTVEGWIYCTSNPATYSTIFSNYSVAGATAFAIFSSYNNSKITLYVGGSTAVLSSATITLNTWIHVAAVRSNGVATLYINGVSQGTVSYAGSASGDGIARIGCAGDGPTTTNFQGYISNVSWVIGTALYTANFAPPAQPLTAITNTSLLTLQSNQAVNNSQFLDMSSNSLVITRAGDVNVGTFAPFGSNWSTYLATSANYINITFPATTPTIPAGTAYTMEAWIYLSVTPPDASGGTIVDTGINGIAFCVTSSLTLRLVKNNVGTIGLSTGTVSLNNWYHVAVTRTGSTATFWINGASAGTVTDSTAYSAGSSGTIGAPSPYYYQGYISNLRVVVGAALYTSTFTPSATPLTNSSTGTTILLTCQNSNFVDNSPNAATLTIVSAPKVQRFSPFSNYLQTPTSYSTKFNGSSDYLSIPNINFSTNAFTIEGWFYPTTVAATTNFWGTDNGSGSVPKMLMYVDSSNRLTVDCGNAASGQFPIVASIATYGPIINQWNHIALVRSDLTATGLKLYINGVLASTGQLSINLNVVTAAFTVGYIGEAYGNKFSGNISNFRIVNGTAVYTANFTPSTAPLTAVANTSLLTCQDATIKDNSTSTVTLTPTGSPTPYQYNPFGYTTSGKQSYTPAVYGGSAYFDGTGDYLSLTDSNNALDLSASTSLEMWVYPTQGSAFQCIYAKGGGANSFSTTNGIYYTLAWIPNVFRVYYNAAGVSASISDPTTRVINNWYHVALTTTATTISLFVNGVRVATVAAVATKPTTRATVYVANSFASEYFYGYVSNLRIINGAAAYTSNFVPPAAPLTATANTTFLLGTSPAIADYSMQNNLESFGDAKISTAVKKYNNASLYFDGTGDYLTAPSNTAFAVGTGDFTVECWFYTAVGTNNGIFQISDTSGGFKTSYTNSLSMFLSGGKLNTYGIAGTGATSTGASYATSTWVHLAVVRSSSVTKIYANGILDTTFGTAGAITDTTNYSGTYLVVGGYYSTSYLWNGYIDDLRITKGLARYTANFTPPTSALLTV